MADNKSKPLMTGYMMSTQLMEIDGCNRCQECMKWCPTFAVRPDRPEITPMYKNAKWRQLFSRQHGLRAKIFGEKPLNEDEMTKFTEDTYMCTTCGVCGTVCEAGIKTVDLWEAMRPNLVKRGNGPYGKQSFFPQLLAKDRNPYMAKQEDRLCWVPKDAKVNDSGDTIYFAGCTAAYRQQALGVATVRILNKLNVEFGMLGKDEWCCASAWSGQARERSWQSTPSTTSMPSRMPGQRQCSSPAQDVSGMPQWIGLSGTRATYPTRPCPLSVPQREDKKRRG
jgi:heterodisulfide reductase subunit D